jgi:ABC-type branched-subunit amino acid transport system permease subunit
VARIGTDEWVAQVEDRIERRRGLSGVLGGLWAAVPLWVRFWTLIALAACFPLLTDSTFAVRVGINALLFAMLALGLNVVVGYAGLLDLGYIAFYGFGAYTYALLSSPQLGIHLPTELTIAIAVIGTSLLGYVLGLPSRRLLGDYLAIVTLFFAQMFVQLLIHLDRVSLPWSAEPVNLTGGPNGIVGVDPMTILGVPLRNVTHSFHFALILFVLLAVAIHRGHGSRMGRAWRALREDPVAAAAMGMPIHRLKLFAFAVGGGIAGLAGSVFAAVQVSVFPQNFEVILLVMIYAAVILGGLGSYVGVVLGGVVMAVFPELLRTPGYSRAMFYGALAIAVVAFLRPWWRLIAVLVATAVLGVLVRGIAAVAWPGADSGRAAGGGVVSRALEVWLVAPPDAMVYGNAGFVLLTAGILLLTQLSGTARLAVLPVVLYLAVFVWETRLVTEPSVTRQLVLGAILVVMMAVRPQGLLGQARVEIT